MLGAGLVVGIAAGCALGWRARKVSTWRAELIASRIKVRKFRKLRIVNTARLVLFGGIVVLVVSAVISR